MWLSNFTVNYQCLFRFLAHLSQRHNGADCNLFIVDVVVVNSSHFLLLSQDLQANFTKLMAQSSRGKD